MISKKLIAILAASAAVACSPISDEAEKIVGKYYIPEVSDTTPLMELNPDGSCTVRAIRPDVLTYSVEGRWDVKRDSLLIKLDPATLQWEGDRELIGDIPDRLGKKVLSFVNNQLSLESDGINYVYQLRK
ncbi:MAG: hypothetical protein K2K68_06465 [Duncaniella sp.]|nr:hypothetical protein [Duncaniella sp.]MDE6581748.1 hypothetical protein [Duncaniella sp.]